MEDVLLSFPAQKLCPPKGLIVGELWGIVFDYLCPEVYLGMASWGTYSKIRVGGGMGLGKLFILESKTRT